MKGSIDALRTVQYNYQYGSMGAQYLKQGKGGASTCFDIAKHIGLNEFLNIITSIAASNCTIQKRRRRRRH